jgi:hypothetical protein
MNELNMKIYVWRDLNWSELALSFTVKDFSFSEIDLPGSIARELI